MVPCPHPGFLYEPLKAFGHIGDDFELQSVTIEGETWGATA